MKRTILFVEGMHCQGCEMLLKDIIQELEGIKLVEASHTNGEISVEFDESRISEKSIREIIKREGYKID